MWPHFVQMSNYHLSLLSNAGACRLTELNTMPGCWGGAKNGLELPWWSTDFKRLVHFLLNMSLGATLTAVMRHVFSCSTQLPQNLYISSGVPGQTGCSVISCQPEIPDHLESWLQKLV
jgi:hypothetical protein